MTDQNKHRSYSDLLGVNDVQADDVAVHFTKE